jgi:hypothetical protein
MKTKSFTQNPRRGSALLAAMIVIVILTFAAAGVLSYSLTTYRNSVRQALLDQGKEIADSEMENMYYNWKQLLLKKTSVANIESHMASAGLIGSGLQPLAVTFQQGTNPWTVSRSIAPAPIPGTVDGGATGIVPGTSQIGKNYYFTVETSATVNAPLLGNVTYDSGRHFVYSNTSLFQYAVFYQGNLEMSAGGNMTIGGPVSTNASAYLGAQDNNGSPFTLTLTDSVAYFQNYNGAADPLSGETDLLQGTSSLVDPVYNPNPQAAAPVAQAAQRALQVTKLSAQSSFIGGVDVAADIANPSYAAAYTNLGGQVDPNEIYRAVIAPPPLDSSGNLLAEDQTVAGSRMYNNAGILITIEQTSSGSANASSSGNTVIHVGMSPEATTPANPANVSMYDNLPQFATLVHPTGGTGASTDIITGVRQTVIDPRETLNGSSGVAMTTIDIGNLNNALQGAMSNPALSANYNGVVYIYDNTNNSSVSATPNLNGIRIVDATTTPAFNDQNNNPLGFSVVSNNGVYVQGDYNTTPITVSGSSVNNPAAIMGDAITALSQGWSITAAGTLQPISSREATASLPTAPNLPANPGINNAGSLGTANGMTVNAAILTGNTPTTTSTNSGGAQNLVRMVEDWYYPDPLGNGTGMALTLNGSLGQLFTSKYFSGAYAPGVQAGLGTGSRVYIQPKSRIFNYDLGFKNRTPAGSPSTTAFTRGDFFFW